MRRPPIFLPAIQLGLDTLCDVQKALALKLKIKTRVSHRLTSQILDHRGQLVVGEVSSGHR
jgi:hypothetical protein